MTEEDATIRRILEGDVEAFGLLVNRYRGPVIRMIRNIVGDGHLSEDVSQEVFLRAYGKLASFDPALSRFSTWLFTIARNLGLNAFKKRKRIPTPRDLPEEVDHSAPHERLVRGELFEKLDAALDGLPPKLRTALILSDIEQLPYADVAQIEGIRIGTVKSRISRARRKLRSALNED